MREGSATDAFTQCPEIYVESKCFSIIHGEHFTTLDLVFPTHEEFLHWTVGLRYLLAKKLGMWILKTREISFVILCVAKGLSFSLQTVLIVTTGYDVPNVKEKKARNAINPA